MTEILEQQPREPREGQRKQINRGVTEKGECVQERRERERMIERERDSKGGKGNVLYQGQLLYRIVLAK